MSLIYKSSLDGVVRHLFGVVIFAGQFEKIAWIQERAVNFETNVCWKRNYMSGATGETECFSRDWFKFYQCSKLSLLVFEKCQRGSEPISHQLFGQELHDSESLVQFESFKHRIYFISCSRQTKIVWQKTSQFLFLLPPMKQSAGRKWMR